MLRPDPIPRTPGAEKGSTPAQGCAPDEAASSDGGSDRALHAALARFTGGVSPAALALAWFDCASHLALSPAKQSELAAKAALGALQNLDYAMRCAQGSPGDPCGCALPNDSRFRAPEWRAFPFNLYAHAFLSVERWWEAATTGVRGASRR